MDGYRLCMEVRSRPAIACLPFVLYTSTYNSPGDRTLAESLGA
jgi:CheY-like chemotaxis protein